MKETDLGKFTAEFVRQNVLLLPVCASAEYKFLVYLMKCLKSGAVPVLYAGRLVAFDFSRSVGVVAVRKDVGTPTTCLVLSGEYFGIIATILDSEDTRIDLATGWQREHWRLCEHAKDLLALRRYRKTCGEKSYESYWFSKYREAVGDLDDRGLRRQLLLLAPKELTKVEPGWSMTSLSLLLHRLGLDLV